MPNSRVPAAKAAVSGAALRNPRRYRGRTPPSHTRPIGEPYASMTAAQKEAWAEYAAEMPWLHSAHRLILRLACVWTAKLDGPNFGVTATRALSALLSKLGGSPVDAARVAHAAEDDDPDAELFRPH